MRCKINNNSDFDISEIEDLLQDLFSFSQKRHGFKKPVSLNLISDQTNTSPLGKTAHYDPSTMEVVVYVDGRHPKDIMRSFSHELVHHNQNENGMFDNITGHGGDGYAQTNPHLRKMEKEAYLKGNMCFRDWEDGYKSSNPNILNERRIYKMSIKDWKNKELNGLLNERWGFSMDLSKLNESNCGSHKRDDDKKCPDCPTKNEEKKKKGKHDDGDGHDERCDYVDCKKKEANESYDSSDASTADGQYYDPEGHKAHYEKAAKKQKKKKETNEEIDPSTADGQYYDPEEHEKFYKDANKNKKKETNEEIDPSTPEGQYYDPEGHEKFYKDANKNKKKVNEIDIGRRGGNSGETEDPVKAAKRIKKVAKRIHTPKIPLSQAQTPNIEKREAKLREAIRRIIRKQLRK